jgi:hypothetical protein
MGIRLLKNYNYPGKYKIVATALWGRFLFNLKDGCQAEPVEANVSLQ